MTTSIISTTSHRFAILLIASCAICTSAGGQNVYKCGNSYSQLPCPDGQSIKVDDSRTAEQKAAADRTLAHDVARANAMETSRLKAEADATARLHTDSTHGKTKAPPNDGKTGKDHKKSARKNKEPAFFTAKSLVGTPPAAPLGAASMPKTSIPKK